MDETPTAHPASPVRVAVARDATRRGAVAQALALIAPELQARLASEVLIKPNLVSHRRQLAATHADALSATLDAVLGLGARAVVVAEGASDASAGFERFGYRSETWDRPVRFLDLNRQETGWEPLSLMGVDGASRRARVSRTVAQAPCRISLAVAKTHVTTILTLSLKNMLSCLHPDDRVMMHGYPPGQNGFRGWRRGVVAFLKRDDAVVRALTRLLGCMKTAQGCVWRKNRPDGWHRLSARDWDFLRSVEALNRNLVALTRLVGPHVSVVDGFVAMHGEGPRHGSAIALGTVVAGTDPVAVDAVAAAVMGFDPGQIGYLRYAQDAGLGTADLDRITIVGDPIAMVRRRCVPHSHFAIQRHGGPWPQPWDRGPHVRPGAVAVRSRDFPSVSMGRISVESGPASKPR